VRRIAFASCARSSLGGRKKHGTSPRIVCEGSASRIRFKLEWKATGFHSAMSFAPMARVTSSGFRRSGFSARRSWSRTQSAEVAPETATFQARTGEPVRASMRSSSWPT